MNTANLSNPLFTLTIGEFIELNKTLNKELIAELMYENKTPINAEKEILSVEEAAEFLKITKSCLYKMNCYRQIPHLKRNKRVLYKRSELLEWLSEGRIKTQKEIEQESLSYLASRIRKK